jgi:hypothetical protein
MKETTTLRKIAVSQGRAMVGVMHVSTRKPATIGVCPACWNCKEQRIHLLTKLSKMGYRVACNEDLAEGKYFSGKGHAPGCRHNLKSADPWTRFKSALAESYRT